jgi:hypothetical protein
MTIRTYDKADLIKRNLQVKLEIDALGMSKKDKGATEAMLREQGASRKAAAVIKNIYNPDNPILKKIKTQRGLLRNTHVSLTGPWEDTGFRIITAKAYDGYKKQMDELVDEFNASVEDFVRHRDDIVADAQGSSFNLGKMFDESEYPSKEQIRAAFRAEVITEVIPDRSRIELDMDKERTQKIVDEATGREQERVQELLSHVANSVKDELTKMHEALSRHGVKEEGNQRAQGFRDTLVPRMQKLAALIPSLNITGDPALDKLGQEIAEKLCVVPSAELRKDPEAREQVAKDAEELLGNLDHIFGGGPNP